MEQGLFKISLFQDFKALKPRIIEGLKLFLKKSNFLTKKYIQTCINSSFELILSNSWNMELLWGVS